MAKVTAKTQIVKVTLELSSQEVSKLFEILDDIQESQGYLHSNLSSLYDELRNVVVLETRDLIR